MKHTFRIRFLIGLMLITALFAGIPTPVFAAGNSVDFSPSSGTSQLGNNFSSSVDGFATGTWWQSSSSITGTISFPASLLKVTSINRSGGTFANGNVTPDNTNGKISFSLNCGWFCGVSNQNVHLFTINFESLTSGKANVDFSGVQYNTGAAAMTGAVYTITSPPQQPATSPSSSPSPRPVTTPSSSPKPTTIPKTPTPTTTQTIASAVTTSTPEETTDPVAVSDGGLKIQNVKVSTTRLLNRVSWTINNTTAIPEFTYGTEKSNLKSDGTISKQNDGSFVVELRDLKPGTLYYFLIKAATADNLQGANYSGVLTTRGYPVQLTIEQNNLLISGAKVKLDTREFVTDKNAMITTELSDGPHTAVITPVDSTDSFSASFTVEKKEIPDNGNPPIQSFTLNITTSGGAASSTTLAIPIIGGAIALLLGLSGFVGFMLFRRKKHSDNGSSVDSDLLAATYGTAITEYNRNNTPEPNLSMNIANQGAMLSQQSDPYFQTVPQAAPFDDGSLPSSSAPVSAMMANAPQAFEQQAVAPAPYFAPPAAQPGMPAPLSSQEPVQTATSVYATPPQLPVAAPIQAINQPAVSPEGYTEAEQLSPDLNAAESIESVENAETSQDSSPSAIYDPETGDLAIVHHHTSTSSIPTNTPAQTQEPIPIPASSQDPSTLQVAPTSQPTMPTTTEQPVYANPVNIPVPVPSPASPAAITPLPVPTTPASTTPETVVPVVTASMSSQVQTAPAAIAPIPVVAPQASPSPTPQPVIPISQTPPVVSTLSVQSPAPLQPQLTVQTSI